MIALDTQFVASSQQVSTEMPDELIILNLADGTYYGLDPVSAFIWHHIQTPRSIVQMVDALTSEYDVSADEACADILQLLDTLRARGLVELVIRGD
jgi:hypothetical protein